MTIKTDLTRRSFMKSAAAGAGAAAVPMALTGCGGDDDNDSSPEKVVSLSDSSITVMFGHGVASGDPLQDRVILWTRVSHTEDSAQVIPVAWKVATDEAMTDVVASGITSTSEASDYTVKVDATGLTADTDYYYQFTGPVSVTSDVGMTKTLPSGFVDQVKFAVCSCANYPAGFFNVYQAISESDVDVVLHLGDYIYEYQNGQYPAVAQQATGRAPDPTEEVVTLDDYRKRYSQYRIDDQAKLAHQKKPFICVWDDHEIANDSYKTGAENHNEGEGEYAARKAAAIQAYHEWLPIRTGEDKEKIYRNFKFGELISLNMLDTRHVGRDKALSITDLLSDPSQAAAKIADPSRRLIGDEQLNWLQNQFLESSATWEVLGQQVLMGRIMVPQELLLGIDALTKKLEAGEDATAERGAVFTLIQQLYPLKLQKLAGVDLSTDDDARLTTVAPYNLDAWDGYFVEREQILGRASALNKNLVSLAGDTHNAWASDLRNVINTTTGELSKKPVGIEFATSSVTSPGFDEYLSLSAVEKVSFDSAIMALVDDLEFFDSTRRGFLELTFTPEEVNAQWKFVADVSTRNALDAAVPTDSTYAQLQADGMTPEGKAATFKAKARGNSSKRLIKA